MTHDTEALKALLAGAVVQYECAKDHAHVTDLPGLEMTPEGLWLLRFGAVTCPVCEASRTGYIPDSHIRAIWGQTGGDSDRARLAEIARQYPPGSRMPTTLGATSPSPPRGWPA